jgi:hypothetical protein
MVMLGGTLETYNVSLLTDIPIVFGIEFDPATFYEYS